MTHDITTILDAWPYDPDHLVRRIEGNDGKPKLQVRLPLGIEQYELNGRPDGKTPEGCESLLVAEERRLAEHIAQTGSDVGFTLTEEECRCLHEEGLLFYYRYLLCYQIGEFKIVKRDTERNMRLFRFVGKYGERKEDRAELEQYWPYILRINGMASAFDALSENDEQTAIESLEKSMEGIEALKDVDSPVFSLERDRSLKVLQETIESIEAARPVSEREQLAQRLERAVQDENYEQAARLRDIIARMHE